LLVVLSIIGVLLGITLQAVQSVRLSTARAQAASNLRQLGSAVQAFYNDNAGLPQGWGPFADWCALNSDRCNQSFIQLKPDGHLYGWQYSIVRPETNGTPSSEIPPPSFQLEAEPIYPGVTGAESLVMTQDGNITSTPTPGADEGRRQMFARLRDRGAGVISDLLSMNPDASSLVRGYVGAPGRVATVFSMLDQNGDGTVDIREIQNFPRVDTPTQADPLASFFAFVSDEMKLDMISPDLKGTIGVHLSDLRGDPTAQFFSFDGLCDLTRAYVNNRRDDDGGVANGLCAKLEAAEDAEARGNDEAKQHLLDAYTKQLAAQTGKSLTRVNATTLTRLAQTLRAD
jgi:type II secretory pathway pseudopilin PulG